jgi:hypothetical protein
VDQCAESVKWKSAFAADNHKTCEKLLSQQVQCCNCVVMQFVLHWGRAVIQCQMDEGTNVDGRFFSREAAKNAKERACDGFCVPSPEEISSATEFRPLHVLCGFA